MVRYCWLLLLLPFTAQADTLFRVGADTSVILNVCVPELNGEGFLHVDEDVFGLVIQVVNSAGGSVALYDAAGEIEDVSVAGTWSAPSANNVRASPDAGALDCTELQFADGVFDADEVYSLRISDAQATIMDYTAQVVALSTTSDVTAAMQSASNAALVALALDHLMSTAVTGTDVADNSLFAKLFSKSATADFDTYDNETDSLEKLGEGAATTLVMHELLDTAFLNCTVDTANFSGSTTTLACDLTDRDGGAVSAATGDLSGLEVRILSGDQQFEARYINTTTWDAANSELRITLSRALPATLADAVTAIIR